MSYAFRPAIRADLPMLRGWLETPEVRRWWGDPDEQFALLDADLDDARMTMRIVSFDGKPFAYVQHCLVHDWAQTPFAYLPADARAIDAFIGESMMIGKGHGGRFLRLLAEELIADGAPLLAIDPDSANGRARAAYARAGFVEDSIFATEDGPVALMLFGAAPASR
jgi:aminoglycoside 6'-N-acetyltransferase